MIWVRVSLLVTAVAQAFSACVSHDTMTPPDTSASLDTVASVDIPSVALSWPYVTSAQISAVARSAKGDTLLGRTATWSSSDTTLIRVEGTSGTLAFVTGVDFGTAEISAAIDGKVGRRSISYSLNSPPLSIVPDTSVMAIGMTRQLRVQRTSGVNRGGFVLGHVQWHSSNPGVASIVDTSGEVTIVGEGHATITGDLYGQHLTADVFGTRFASPITFSSYSVGGIHACGLAQSGVAYCWGSNDQGQLGSTGMMDTCLRFHTAGGGIVPRRYRCSEMPVPVETSLTFASISAGGRTTCAVTAAGAAYCWGRNAFGMTGTGAPDTIVATPAAVQGGITFRMVDVGDDQVCGVSTSDAAYCWGSNAAGALGIGTVTNSAIPTLVSGSHTWGLVRAGRTSCGVATDSTGYCWGANDYTQTGAPAGTETCMGFPSSCNTTPVRVSATLTFTDIGSHPTGGHVSCGLTTTGAVYCWGEELVAALTTGPVPVGGGPFAMLDARGPCASTTAGGMYCWRQYPFTAVASMSTFSATSFEQGPIFRCAMDAGHALWCWDTPDLLTDSPGSKTFLWWANDSFSNIVIGSTAPVRLAGQP